MCLKGDHKHVKPFKPLKPFYHISPNPEICLIQVKKSRLKDEHFPTNQVKKQVKHLNFEYT